jgi:hypothetical protein
MLCNGLWMVIPGVHMLWELCLGVFCMKSMRMACMAVHAATTLDEGDASKPSAQDGSCFRIIEILNQC